MTEARYEAAMRRAAALAGKGRRRTCPNPAVGAVLLRGDEIVAEGWHHAAGRPHAEIECLADARAKGVDPRGCDMVVTLEPCSHHGKTPPCSEALVEAGVARVVIGMRDPNPEAAGGAERLREAGIEVIGPVLEDVCRDLVEDFLIWQATDRPHITLKLASTLDGRIATRDRRPQLISNEASRRSLHVLRAALGSCGGAVLVGGGTFRMDNPRLTARDAADVTRQPLACILTSRLPQADADFHLLRERPQDTVFFASPAASASTAAHALADRGARVFSVGKLPGGGTDFAGMFRIMRRELGCHHVLCEGGARLGTSLLDAGLVDELLLHVSPRVLGDNEAIPLFDGRSPLSMDDALRMRVAEVGLCDGDVHIRLKPVHDGAA